MGFLFLFIGKQQCALFENGDIEVVDADGKTLIQESIQIPGFMRKRAHSSPSLSI